MGLGLGLGVGLGLGFGFGLGLGLGIRVGLSADLAPYRAWLGLGLGLGFGLGLGLDTVGLSADGPLAPHTRHATRLAATVCQGKARVSTRFVLGFWLGSG